MWALVCIYVLLPHTVRAQLAFASAGALGAQAPAPSAFTVTDPSSLSVLSRFASNGHVELKPYPYLVVNSALPPELYRALEAEFLTDAAILALNGETERKQNFRYDVPATRLLGQGAAKYVPPLWQQFARYHTSRAFYDEVDAILGAHIRKLHPLKPNFRTGVRCVPHAAQFGRLDGVRFGETPGPGLRHMGSVRLMPGAPSYALDGMQPCEPVPGPLAHTVRACCRADTTTRSRRC